MPTWRPTVRPAPNGLPFPADHAAWRPIGSTERFDNGSLRQILGNDVAVGAIETGETRRWPDGTAFADTVGWGWARWRGADLQPYGTSAAFTAECVGCHAPILP